MPPPESSPVRLLLVEDSPADAELIVRALRGIGRAIEERRIDTRAEWDAAMAEPAAWDVVLLDYGIARIDITDLIADLARRAPWTPAIVVSGSISEESAVSVLRAGARDFVTKQNMTRLVPAVLRELAAAVAARERRAVEIALDESEARVARLIDNAQDIVTRYRVKPTRAYEYVSPAVQTILGYEPEAFYADPDFAESLIHPDDLEAVRATRKSGPEGTYTNRMLAKDGRVVWIERREVAIRDADGEVVALEGIARDVTSQIQADEDARSKDRMFRAVFDGALDALLLVDADRVYVDANPAACALFGVPLAEIVGRRVEEFSGLAAYDVEAGWAQFLADGRQSGEFVLLRPDGETRTTEFTAAANVEPHIHLTILRDVTVRRAQEQELVLSEERFRLAQEGARMGTWDGDLRTGAMTWSDGLRRLYGVDSAYPADLENFLRLVHPDDRERVKEGALTKERSGAHYEFEARVVRPDGEVRWILSRSAPIFDENGALIRVLGVTVDTTEAALAREALEDAADKLRQGQKMEAIGQLAGGVAHDFNNLLTVINGYGDVALNNCGDDPRLRHSLTEIRRAADRATELTRQLLAFSRQQVLKPEILDLNDVVTEHASMLARLLGDDVVLTVTLEAGNAYVEADPGQLAQVVLNLAANARDAMPDGGELIIRTRLSSQADDDVELGLAAGSYVMLEVSDTGSGIDVADQTRLFEPFFTTKNIGEGTGLGLSTVHGIVEQSRGCIVVDSEIGRGTTFRIYLPQSVVPPTTYHPADEPLTSGNETVLLVEDNVMVRDLLETVLTGYGYNVLVAPGPSAAIATAGGFGGEILLLVTDVVMPEMNGRELAEHLSVARPDMKTVFMSGYANDAFVGNGVLPPGTHFLQKPFTASQLAATARQALTDVVSSA